METNQTVIQNPIQSQTSTATAAITKKQIPFKIIGIVVGIVVLLLIVFFAFRFFSNGSKPSTTSEIVWWGLWEDENIVSSAISEYEANNPKVKIKYVRQSKEDYRERLTSALAKGTGPDIFRFHNTWVPMFKSELDKVPANIFTVSDFSIAFYPVAVSDLTVGANLVGVPLEYDGLSLYK